MKMSVIAFLLVASLSGCRKDIPSEAITCAKQTEIWLSLYSKNLQVAHITPPTAGEGNLVNVGVSGTDTKGTLKLAARCETVAQGKDLMINRWWLSVAGPGFETWQDHEMGTSEADRLQIKMGFPFLYGVSFKADGYVENSFGIQWLER
jgi:hypothetical protein